MSRMPVGPLNIDLLVQGAVYGPLGAQRWDPLTLDPDKLGKELIGATTSSADSYVFTPLPIGVTAMEVLKACNFYRYNRGRLPLVLVRLMGAMHSHLEGWEEAPWVWSAKDVEQRAGRPAPGSDGPAPAPAGLMAMVDRLAGRGFVAIGEPRVTRRGVAGKGGVVDGFAWLRHDSTHGDSDVEVVSATDPDTAAMEFVDQVGDRVWGGRHSTVHRHGSLLLAVDLSRPDAAKERVRDLLDELRPPDESWADDEPALVTAEGGLLAGAVDFELRRGVLARTAKDLAELAGLVRDDKSRRLLESVDLRAHAVVALPENPYDAVPGSRWCAAPTAVPGR